jgi:hypothetical protein
LLHRSFSSLVRHKHKKSGFKFILFLLLLFFFRRGELGKCSFLERLLSEIAASLVVTVPIKAFMVFAVEGLLDSYISTVAVGNIT